jgi:beta-lactamase superfamily II metal-dependent hydrolase
MKKLWLTIIYLNLFLGTILGQANGKLQLHFIDVGQADAAILISPQGEIVLFDDGVSKFCDMPVSYIEQLGVKKIDYLIASHYHDDHIGCTQDVLDKFPLQKAAYDRGNSYSSSSYDRYVKSTGALRKTAIIGDSIILDKATKNPVTIKFIASNGAGIPTTNENDLSLVCVIHFEKFDVEMGGDLSGYKSNSYEDIETKMADLVGQVEVYKVHHHGSQYSSNDYWLSKLKPKVGIISASSTFGHNYGHPTEECMERLHNAGIKVYLTENTGSVQLDPQYDVVGQNILVESSPNSSKFTVTYNWNKVDTFSVWGATKDAISNTVTNKVKYGWSKKSSVYHYIDCKYVSEINPTNLVTGNSPPAGKNLHQGCPK